MGAIRGKARFSNPLRLLDDGFEDTPRGSIGGEFGGEIRAKSFLEGMLVFLVFVIQRRTFR